MTKEPKTLSTPECEQLLLALRRSRGTFEAERKGLRNYLAGLLMLDAGIRVGELVQLKISDLIILGRPADGLTIRPEIAKLHLERTVPLTARTKEAVKDCCIHRWHRHVELLNHFAFSATNDHQKMTVRQVERIILAAGMWSLKRRVTPHMLRHTYATRLMRVTNARVVQQLLGHKCLSSTQIYTHPDRDDLENAVKML